MPTSTRSATSTGRAFDAAVQQLVRTGVEVRAVDVEPLLAAATLLYDGAIVAQRYTAVGAFLESRPAGADPTVSRIILGAKDVPRPRCST